MDAVPAAAMTVAGVHKSFGATQALRDVSFSVAPGQVHALLGGNGSGKSTLIKVLAGVLSGDSGRIEVGSSVVEATDVNPGFARSAGLRFVHQQTSTFEHLSVMENLFIAGDLRSSGRPIPWRRLREEARRVLERYGIQAEPTDELRTLGAASQTMVAIARALHSEGGSAGILVLDEPTASLPASEVELLLAALRRCAAAGQSIVFVSHRLEEVLEVADCITVLRDGAVVSTIQRSQTDHGRLVELILGRRIDALAASDSAAVLDRDLLTLSSVHGGPVRDVSLHVRSGEVVGLAGLIGSGRSSLLQMLFGLRQPSGGDIQLHGKAVNLSSASAAMRAGIGFVPGNRPREAAFSELSVAENMSMAVLPTYFRRGVLRRRRESRDTSNLCTEFLVKSSGVAAAMSSLSGGNQQKVVLARWLRRDPSLVLLDEPTQGVDIGAKFEIWSLIRRQVARGMGVLVASSDFEELAAACDRVLVMKAGRIVAELAGDQLTDRNLEHLTLEPA